jgi:hypothetical protein
VQTVQPSGGLANGSIDISVSGGTSPFIYEWYENGQLIASSEDISDLYAGLYQCIITSISGCSDTLTLYLSNNLIDGGYNSESTAPNIGIHSNPGNFPILVPFNGSLPLARLRVYDSGGRLVREEETEEGSSEHPIDLREAPDGFYFLEVQEREQRLWFKLVVQH